MQSEEVAQAFDELDLYVGRSYVSYFEAWLMDAAAGVSRVQ
jgi:hypothetical protein